MMNTLQTAAKRQSSLPLATATKWRVDFASIRGRVYLSIAAQIEEAICTGIFSPGDRLPSQRALAEDLGFHVNTINAAFKEAARRGLVRGCTRRGTVVLPRPST
jgi:DNA-binding transcriptional regulator YhcF (GntR family)